MSHLTQLRNLVEVGIPLPGLRFALGCLHTVLTVDEINVAGFIYISASKATQTGRQFYLARGWLHRRLVHNIDWIFFFAYNVQGAQMLRDKVICIIEGAFNARLFLVFVLGGECIVPINYYRIGGILLHNTSVNRLERNGRLLGPPKRPSFRSCVIN